MGDIEEHLGLFDSEFVEVFGNVSGLDNFVMDSIGSLDISNMNQYLAEEYRQDETNQPEIAGSPISEAQDVVETKELELENFSVHELRNLAHRMKLGVFSSRLKKEYVIECIRKAWSDVYYVDYLNLLEIRKSYLSDKGKSYMSKNAAKRLLWNWATAGHFVYLEVVFSNVPCFVVKENGRRVLAHMDKKSIVEVVSNTNSKIIGKMCNKGCDTSIPKDGTVLEFLFADTPSAACNGLYSGVPSYFNETYSAHLVTPLDIDPRFYGMKKSRYIKLPDIRREGENKEEHHEEVMEIIKIEDEEKKHKEEEEKSDKEEEEEEIKKKKKITKRKKGDEPKPKKPKKVTEARKTKAISKRRK